ncbi:MAG: T9SS type A sorting domain-containing protein [Flavobacteriales bacterium]|nr:T9SS type A sorting domain-containing protein [Flavobacteriales bacterium]
MQKTNIDKLKKLAAYSSAAIAASVVATPASAELVGYDVDPDSTFAVGDTLEHFAINLNNQVGGYSCDPTMDVYIAFQGKSEDAAFGVLGSVYYGSFIGNNNPYRYSSSAVTNTFKTTYGATSTTTYLTTITDFWPTCAVGATGSAASSGVTNWASEIHTEGQLDIGTNTIAWGYANGNSWAAWGGKTDKYLGLRFNITTEDTLTGIWDTSLHYGWIYMSVGVHSETLAIQAWAYETEPGGAALYDIAEVDFREACNKFVGIDDRSKGKISIYGHQRDVSVTLERAERARGRITIYEINGRKVQEETIKERATRFSINGSGTGIYMVKVDVDGGNSRTKKVYIE